MLGRRSQHRRLPRCPATDLTTAQGSLPALLRLARDSLLDSSHVKQQVRLWQGPANAHRVATIIVRGRFLNRFPLVTVALTSGASALRTVRGFCARGSACPYQHDAMPPAVHFAAPFPPFSQPFPLPGQPFPPPTVGGLSPRFNAGAKTRKGPPSSYTQLTGPRQPAPPRPPRGSSRVISIDNIPPASLTEAAVRHFFQPFGHILSVGIDEDNRTATITFSTPHQADRAVASPQAVFGNRFVRVYRAHDSDAVLSPSGPGEPDPGEPGPGIARAAAAASTTSPPPARVSVSATRAELLERNAQQQRSLLSEFEHADSARKSAIMGSLRSLASEADKLRSGSSASDRAAVPADPRARLKELQREVRSPSFSFSCAADELLALDPQAEALGIDTAPPSISANTLQKPHDRARQRPPPRRHPQQFRLDNRSRKLRIGPLERDDVLDQLRAHLEASQPVVSERRRPASLRSESSPS